MKKHIITLILIIALLLAMLCACENGSSCEPEDGSAGVKTDQATETPVGNPTGTATDDDTDTDPPTPSTNPDEFGFNASTDNIDGNWTPHY